MNFLDCFDLHYDRYAGKFDDVILKFAQSKEEFAVFFKGKTEGVVVFDTIDVLFQLTVQKITGKFAEILLAQKLSLRTDQAVKLIPQRPSSFDFMKRIESHQIAYLISRELGSYLILFLY